MQTEKIPFKKTTILRDIILDYLYDPQKLQEYFSFTPDIQGIADAIEARKKFTTDRATLVEVLREQYQKTDAAFLEDGKFAALQKNLTKLSEENTFTVTTGHQLQIFGGPLYYFYKIIGTICLANKLNEEFPENHFVPVYWMASEDHDFEEISHFFMFGKKWEWQIDAKGKVGALSPASMEPLLKELEEVFPQKDEAQELLQLFRKAYLEQPDLASATRWWVTQLLGEHGLVTIDPDDARLKKKFTKVVEQDVLEQSFYPIIEGTKQQLEQHYKMPVNPRQVNFFWLEENFRGRIEQDGENYVIIDSGKKFTKQELQEQLQKHPEKFSANVVMRPMYQEAILPNLAYIGGTNEIAYWFELKPAFEKAGVFFPQLLLRDSVLWLGQSLQKKMDKHNLAVTDLFRDKYEVAKEFMEQKEQTNLLEQELVNILQQLNDLRDKAKEYSPQVRSVLIKGASEEMKNLGKLKKDLNKELKDMHEQEIDQINKVFDIVFTDGVFQERYDNFMPYYLRHGKGFIDVLLQNLYPLKFELLVVRE